MTLFEPPAETSHKRRHMMFVIGIVLFALAILVSVALHECGHMWAARATGMTFVSSSIRWPERIAPVATLTMARPSAGTGVADP